MRRSRLAAQSRLLALGSRHPLGHARPLLLLHLRERQSGTDCDYVEDGMQWIGWQAQPVHLFPRPNANVRRIQVRTQLRQLVAPLLRALVLFERKALGVSLDGLSRGASRGRLVGERPGCSVHESLQMAVWLDTRMRNRAHGLSASSETPRSGGESALAVLTLTVKSYGPRLRPAGPLGGPTYLLVAAHRSPWRSTLATRFATVPDKPGSGAARRYSLRCLPEI